MFNRKGQSTLEYALIIAVVVAGLLLMQHYVRRGYAGRLKSASDEMGEQYDPTSYTGNFTISQSSNTTTTVKNRETQTNYTTAQISSRTGNETVSAWTNNTKLFGQ
jgi:hypothetical protein